MRGVSVLEEMLAAAYDLRRAHARVLAVRAVAAEALAPLVEARTVALASCYYRGFSVSEVAELLGTSRSRAQELVADARELYAWRPEGGVTLSVVWSPGSAPGGFARTAADNSAPGT